MFKCIANINNSALVLGVERVYADAATHVSSCIPKISRHNKIAFTDDASGKKYSRLAATFSIGQHNSVVLAHGQSGSSARWVNVRERGTESNCTPETPV